MERYTHAIGRKPQPMSSCWTLAKVKLNDFQNFRLLGLDPSQLLYHILLNFVTVHVTNHLLMATVCQDQLLACCDPCNWSWTSYVPMCVWLWGHFFAYMQAGYTYGRKSYSNHINLLICQVAWFYSEYYSYMSVYEKEVKDFHSHPEFGRNVKALPCDNVVYYSTWVPIWEDYIYNTLGQFAGYLLFCYVEKRRQQPSSLSLPLYHEHDYQSSSPPAKDLLNGFSKKSSGLRNVVVEGNNSVGGDIMVRAKARYYGSASQKSPSSAGHNSSRHCNRGKKGNGIATDDGKVTPPEKLQRIDGQRHHADHLVEDNGTQHSGADPSYFSSWVTGPARRFSGFLARGGGAGSSQGGYGLSFWGLRRSNKEI